MFKYKFYTNSNGQKVVLCLASYKGKTVKGKAVCSAEDVYDEEFGKTLARTRCDVEYYRRRVKDTFFYKTEKEYAIKKAKADFAKADDLFRKACLRFTDASSNLHELTETK